MSPYPEWPPLSFPLPDFLARAIEFDDAVSFGAGDERVAVWQAGTPGRRLDGAFPLNPTVFVNFNNLVLVVLRDEIAAVGERFDAGPCRHPAKGDAADFLEIAA